MDFFLIADGARGGQNVWKADPSQNRDGIQHLTAFAEPGSPYLLIGFEDMYNGGDRDYNDALFVVDIGTENVQKLVGAPEPMTMGLLGVVGVALASRRLSRRKNKEPDSDSNLSDS